MVQEGTHNPNVTLKGYPKKSWGLFGQKAHKTQLITLFLPKRGCLSLTLTSHGQTYNPKGKPNCRPNEALRFSWDGSMHSTHNTAKFPDWLNSQNQVFSLVKIMSSLSWSLCNFSQPDFHHVCPSHIYICHTSHICGRIFKQTTLKVQYNKKKNTIPKSKYSFRNCVTTQ